MLLENYTIQNKRSTTSVMINVDCQ